MRSVRSSGRAAWAGRDRRAPSASDGVPDPLDVRSADLGQLEPGPQHLPEGVDVQRSDEHPQGIGRREHDSRLGKVEVAEIDVVGVRCRGRASVRRQRHLDLGRITTERRRRRLIDDPRAATPGIERRPPKVLQQRRRRRRARRCRCRAGRGRCGCGSSPAPIRHRRGGRIGPGDRLASEVQVTAGVGGGLGEPDGNFPSTVGRPPAESLTSYASVSATNTAGSSNVTAALRRCGRWPCRRSAGRRRRGSARTPCPAGGAMPLGRRVAPCRPVRSRGRSTVTAVNGSRRPSRGMKIVSRRG